MATRLHSCGGRPSARRLVTVALLLLGGACGPGPGVTPTASPEPSDISPLSFDSIVYPYRLVLPGGMTYGTWTPATRSWRADLAIYRGASTNDEVSTVEGRLFIVGAPWNGTLQALETHVGTVVAEHHDCKAPVVRKDLTLGSDPAIGFTQTCGTTDLVFTRVVVVHQNYALAVSLGAVNQAKKADILDVLVEWLKGLTWTGS
jgi:hypothetical protein